MNQGKAVSQGRRLTVRLDEKTYARLISAGGPGERSLIVRLALEQFFALKDVLEELKEELASLREKVEELKRDGMKLPGQAAPAKRETGEGDSPEPDVARAALGVLDDLMR
ncbi:MAG: hypothetical protein HSCHL_2030 [Hydrogenibacillus schlegelii]|uniref:Uncharacterized protein n=1 Tax=Hydrogenibacillus schlegelii TaxID=1484 RepID=A0A2T5G421_HYDSH|nr:hypothetical protein [Hydrogenibacillus schlegelii]PTQ50941.1 MAG: hypothetical protein HSCHL_2030 [Hydrogenibacillus schlegelii]